MAKKNFRDYRKQKILSQIRTQIRPPTKVDEKELLSAIVKIAMTASAAQEHQRSEVIRTVKTLDQLTAALGSKGFDLRWSSVYM